MKTDRKNAYKWGKKGKSIKAVLSGRDHCETFEAQKDVTFFSYYK